LRHKRKHSYTGANVGNVTPLRERFENSDTKLDYSPLDKNTV
jgi:hypothetical protein